MPSAEAKFESICDDLTTRYDGVARGKMMSSPGLKFGGKVFTFFHNDRMVFKLEEGYDIEAHGVVNHSLLNPFKTKPPLRAWFEAPSSEMRFWEDLAEQALRFASKT